MPKNVPIQVSHEGGVGLRWWGGPMKTRGLVGYCVVQLYNWRRIGGGEGRLYRSQGAKPPPPSVSCQRYRLEESTSAEGARRSTGTKGAQSEAAPSSPFPHPPAALKGASGQGPRCGATSRHNRAVGPSVCKTCVGVQGRFWGSVGVWDICGGGSAMAGQVTRPRG